MIRGKVKITCPTGLHMRPAGILCKHAAGYKSTVEIDYKSASINAKSVLSVLGACIRSGEEIELVCAGPDEQEAFNDLISLIADGLEE